MDGPAWLEVRLPLGGAPDRLLGAPPPQRDVVHAPVVTLAGMHDPVTGLAGPVLALDRLVQASAGLARESTGLLLLCAVVRPDPDDAQRTRLRDAADRLSRVVRPGDTVARWHDDALLALCHQLQDVPSAERLRSRAAAALQGHEVRPGLGLSAAVMWDRLSQQQLLTLTDELVALGRTVTAPHPLLEVSCA